MTTILKNRKIPSKLENPIDNIIINVGRKFYKLFRKLNFTPNHLTFISMILGLLSIYFFYTKKYILSSILYFVSYCFDVFDGNYARTYNMVTEFGDSFDHIKDISVNILFILVFIKYTTLINYKIYLIITVSIFILMSVHLGCQEQYVSKRNPQNNSKYLKAFEPYCKKNAIRNMKILKYMGCGTFASWISFIILLHIF